MELLKTFKNKNTIYNLYVDNITSIVDNKEYYYIKMIDNDYNIYLFNKHYNYNTNDYYYTCYNIYTEKNIKVNKTIQKNI
jgi:hypothetical protein